MNYKRIIKIVNMKKLFKNVTVITIYLHVSEIDTTPYVDKYVRKTGDKIMKKFRRKYKKIEGLIIPTHGETRIEITKY